MQQHSFIHNKLKFSYLDSGGKGPIIIALHSHWMESATFIPLAAALAPEWRIVALDQRGHGYSDHASSYTREDYLDDLSAFLAHLNINKPVVLLGNSLGGINAYHFAARYPELVHALIIEDIGAVVFADPGFSLKWEGTFATREDLEQCVGPNFIPFLQDSFRQTERGWRLAFNPEEIATSINLSNGNHWKEWLATDCPALLIRGQNSRLTTQAHFEEMALRRPNTQLQVLEGGHVVHVDNPTGFANVVRAFLQEHKI